MFNRSHVLLAALIATASVNAQTDTARQSQLDEFVLTGIRATSNTPVTQYNLSSKQIKEMYYGADLPVMLQQAPSIQSYSDNGTGIGYSFFRMRGMDQSRLNVTVNGVPINDPENQGTFFNNFADLSSSAQSIQIQRGVGTSTNGSAAFGGSINILTRNLSEQSSAEVNAGIGSFNSRRLTAEVQTGRVGNYAFYTRISNLATDGYRDRSGSEITSYLFSAGRFGKKSLIIFNMWGGDAQNQLSYLGVDEATLQSNRKANALTKGETDRFRQHFFQLQYQYTINQYSGVNASAYYVRGLAPQFQAFFGASPFFGYSFYNMPEPVIGADTIRETDAMVSYRLDQHFSGGFANYYYHTKKFELDAGFHANHFTSDHFMEVQWMRVLPEGIDPNHQVYFNTGTKSELSGFVKFNYFVTRKWNVFSDVQIRNAMFKYQPKTMQYAAAPFTVEPMTWNFVNPKIGTQYQVNTSLQAYAMVGISNREPTRFDYFQDDYATRNVKQSDIKPEQVVNIESGIRFQNRKLQLQTNFYLMQFENAIINTGELNMFGYPITTNVKESSRAGFEIDGVWKMNKYIWLNTAAAFSQNTIRQITQFYSDSNFTSQGITYNNTSSAMSPQIIMNTGVNLFPVKWLQVDLNMRHVSEQYVDNSQTLASRIPSYTLVNSRVGLDISRWTKQKIAVAIQVNNLMNAAYLPWANVGLMSNVIQYGNDGVNRGVITPQYFAAPLRNYFVTVTWTL